MKQELLKALAKKLKLYKQEKNKNSDDSDDSDGYISSEDEDEISHNMLYKWFNNRYIIIKYLGRGTFCRVWMVYDIVNKQFYAMKMNFPKFYEDTLHEIEVNKYLNNKDNYNTKIIKYYDNFIYDKNGKYNCIIFELLGYSLLDVLSEYEDLKISIIKKILRQIFFALNELHSKNLIHTDIKPENILFIKKTKKIEQIIDFYTENNIDAFYESNINDNLPENYNEMNKLKRKNVKRKIKLKCQKNVSKFLEEKMNIFNENNENNDKIIDITNKSIDDIENNIELFDFDEENFNIRIIDLGNAEYINKEKIQDEIMIRNYRPPENIINDFFNEKADIWCIGCIGFELFTNDYLFELDKNTKNKHETYRDRLHLKQMFEILGKMPKLITLNCDFTEELFDNKGNILKMKNIESRKMEIILNEDYDYSIEESKEISNFLHKLLKYDINERYSAIEAYNDEWLNN
jgi:serine/threonine-protein kinase SRPK3